VEGRAVCRAPRGEDRGDVREDTTMERVGERLQPLTVAAGARTPLLRRLVVGRLSGLDRGELRIADAGGEIRLGRPAADGLTVRLTVRRARLWRRVVFGGLLAATEAYVDGDWDADYLTALARLFSRNIDQVASLDGGLGRLIRPATWLRYARSRNTKTGARRNISAHYDLGNEFFELMLDPTLTYSCGVFEGPDATLEDASRAKIDRLCRKLALHPGDHLLEIGTGWGAFAMHAASHYGCRVTTTTISRAQHEVAVRRVAEAGLAGRVDVRLADYRDLPGRYSKIVSVEMIEAVGAEYFQAFFEVCASRLTPDGLLAIQAITVADQRFEAARRAPDFIKHHVFPGSCIPSVGALLAASGRGTDFRLVDLEDFTPHYARTLAAWRGNLERRQADVDRLTTERFRRLWRLYLAYCEGGFHERHTGLVQMVMARPDWRGEITRTAIRQPAAGAGDRQPAQEEAAWTAA
jgi:cyclopropane-fatty-acyl-phospholipid synthase